MIHSEHIDALVEFGYSKKQAEFVAAAALHSGYFLARQYNEGRGKAVADLCQKAVRLDHAKVTVYGYRTRLYHLTYRPLYRALGQEQNRNRRDADTYRVRAKLMGFDYILLNPGYRYLPTEQNKLEYFVEELGLPLEAMPTKMYVGESSKTTRFFIDKFPIRVSPDGAVAFCFQDAGVFAEISFRTWLEQYQPLLAALGGKAEIVYCSNTPSRFRMASREFSKLFDGGRASLPADLESYFQQRRDLETRGPAGRTQAELDGYRKLTKRYSTPQAERQYSNWLDSKGQPAQPAVIKFSTFQIPYSYSWFGTAGKELCD